MHITDYKIELRGMHMYARHGVMEQERTVGAWFTVDVAMRLNDARCCDSDSIDDAVNYACIYEIVKREMETPSNLLEHVCKRIADALLSAFDTVEYVDVTLCKDTPPMGGDGLNAIVSLSVRR